MNSTLIHVLLLDGRVLCLDIGKNTISLNVKKMICEFLDTSHHSTYGLMYRDVRGGKRWLVDDRAVVNHEFASCGELIQLVFKIRHVPHCVCMSNKGNFVQLFQHGVRLLRNRWFMTNTKVNSQLIALYLLVHHKSGINTSNIRDFLKEELPDMKLNDNLIKSSPSSDNVKTPDQSPDIQKPENFMYFFEKAYQTYQSKLHSTSDVVLKFLYLMMPLPIFTSEIYVVKRRNGEKFCLGISSKYLTLFKLNSYDDPEIEIPIKTIDQVMIRKIKLVVTFNTFSRSTDCLSNGHTPSNGLIDFYGLSSYQAICIKKNIETAKSFSIKSANINNKLCSDCNGIVRIKDIINGDENFLMELNDWFNKYLQGSLNDNYINDYVHERDGIHLEIAVDTMGVNDLENEFGENNSFEKGGIYEDFYEDLKSEKISSNNQTTITNTDKVKKNNPRQILKMAPNFETMLKEKERLESLLDMKMKLLKNNYWQEKEITGKFPKDYYTVFKTTEKSNLNNSQFYRDILDISDGSGTISHLTNRTYSRMNATTSRIPSSRSAWDSSHHGKSATCRSMIHKKRTPDSTLVGRRQHPQRMPSPYSIRSATSIGNQYNSSGLGSPHDSLTRNRWCNSSSGSETTEYYGSRGEMGQYDGRSLRSMNRQVPNTLQTQAIIHGRPEFLLASANTLGVDDEYIPTKSSNSAFDLSDVQFHLESPSDQAISPLVNENSTYSNLTVYTLSPCYNQDSRTTHQFNDHQTENSHNNAENDKTININRDSVFSQEDLV